MFIRKLYYDRQTGAVIESHMREGDVVQTIFADDVAVLPSLAGRTDADTGCIRWTSPDADVEALFRSKQCLTVDQSGATPVPVFTDYPPEPEPEPTPEPEPVDEPTA